MQVGVSTATLFNRLPNEEAVELLNEWKIPCSEVFLTSFCEYEKSFGELIAKNKGNLPVHSMHVLNIQIEPQLFSTNARVKEDSFSLLDKALQAGEAFGAKYYTFHGIARYKKATIEGKDDDFLRYANVLKEIDNFCKSRHGIALSLENVEWALANRPQAFDEILKNFPDLSTVLDVKQARISGYSVDDYLKSMGKNLSHVHLSDVDENGKIRLPGEGNFDFAKLIKQLSDVGFNGPLLVEVYSGDYQDLSAIKRSCTFLEEIIYKYSL